MDAIVAERLSSSPRTFDLFGFCALSILSEYFYHDDIESVVAPGSGYMKAKDLHDEDELKPQNDLTAPQKLALALEMAEGLADLHGYSGGLIIHDDVQLSQYLFNEDKSVLKLNDFNRAEFAFWDEANQEYCRYENGRGGGNVSSRFGFRRVFWIVSNSGVFPWRSGGLLRSTRIGL
jgi:serine/threonine protein kinase